MKAREQLNTEVIEFLNNLRANGAVNMFGAMESVLDNFPDISRNEAKKILVQWMKDF